MEQDNSEEYVAKVVTILDAIAKQDLGDKNSSIFVQKLHLLLQDTDTKVIFQAELDESDVRKIIKFSEPLSSKQMVDLAIALRSREEPLKLLVPKSSTELSADDVMQSRNLDAQKKKKRYRYKKSRWNNKKIVN